MNNFIHKIIFKRKKGGVIVGKNIHKFADDVLREVKKAENILLHCHPSPDPDSVGSALATKFVLESFGKKVTIIKGDSDIPLGFKHFPGAKDIIEKNIFEVNLEDFDLFISVDSASIDQISKKGKIVFPDSLKVINIDHHATNTNFGHINIVEKDYPATAQVLYELFQEWGVSMNADIATNLFMGIYTDTVEFRIALTTPKTFAIAGELAKFVPQIGEVIFDMESSETKENIKFIGLMLESITTHFDDKIALASLPLGIMQNNSITRNDMSGHNIMAMMRLEKDWQVLLNMVEIEPNKIKVSTRSKDYKKYDVSKLCESLGGGGHKAAAGVLMNMPLEDAKKMILLKAKELFGL